MMISVSNFYLHLLPFPYFAAVRNVKKQEAMEVDGDSISASCFLLQKLLEAVLSYYSDSTSRDDILYGNLSRKVQ